MSDIAILMKTQLAVEQHFINNKKPLPQEYIEAVHKLIDGLDENAEAFEERAKHPGLMNLPHPERNLYAGLIPLPMLFLREGVDAAVGMSIEIISILRDLDRNLSDIATILMANYKPIRDMVQSSTVAGMGVGNGGALMNILVPHCWLLNDKPVFHLDQQLCEGLAQTEFGKNTPTQYVRGPLNFAFIEFGDQRNLGIHVHNQESGWHELEGAYVSEQKVDPDPNRYPLLAFMVERGIAALDSPSLRFVEVQYVGSPIGHSNAMDDATQDFVLLIDDDSCDSVGELLDAHMDFYRVQGQAVMNGYRPKDMTTEQEKAYRDCTEILVKALIFINSDLTTKREILNRPPLLRSLKGLKNPAKKRKLKKKLDKTRDYILVSSRESIGYGSDTDQGAKKKTHWRRGHLRNQPHGKKRSETKIVWIQPSLIGSGSGSVKKYIVKE